ncbi:hypothetical protein BDW62DRAFT_220616 [Aspergillus aurantiobrunneus]
MPLTNLPIPPEFQADLEPTTPLDTRSTDEILASIAHPPAVTSEKNIWAFWHAGLSAAPQWCRRNIADWQRICGPEWTIRVLDTVPGSPSNALNFVPPDMLPETFVQGTMAGPYVGPHSADFLRGACLVLHGGVFMDVGILLIRSLDRICWSQLEDPSSPFRVSVPCMFENVLANHFVAARKADPLVTRWHELFLHVWENRTSYEGITQHPLFAFMAGMDLSKSAANGFGWEFVVENGTVFDYVGQVMAWLRLCLLDDAGDGFSCADYAVRNVLWFEVLGENWGVESKVGFHGQDAFDVLATRTDADPASEEYQRAYETVWHVLTQCSMQKVVHGKNLTKTPALGLLWEMEGNEGADVAPGTFAEVLRYGTVHLRQKRRGIRCVTVDKPEQTLRKGVLEA